MDKIKVGDRVRFLQNPEVDEHLRNQFGTVIKSGGHGLSVKLDSGKAVYVKRRYLTYVPTQGRTSAMSNEEKKESPVLELLIDPGDATADDLFELYSALSELHRVHGGTGIVFRDDLTKVYARKVVPA